MSKKTKEKYLSISLFLFISITCGIIMSGYIQNTKDKKVTKSFVQNDRK